MQWRCCVSKCIVDQQVNLSNVARSNNNGHRCFRVLVTIILANQGMAKYEHGHFNCKPEITFGRRIEEGEMTVGLVQLFRYSYKTLFVPPNTAGAKS